jgi:hypothetical protein
MSKGHRKSCWKGWCGLDRRWIHWVRLEGSKRVLAGKITGAITRSTRTPTIRLQRRCKSSWKGWRGLDRCWIHWVCLKWSKRVAGIITGAITRSTIRTPTIGSSVVARVAGRAGAAWITAGFTGFVAGEAKWSERVAGIITGAIIRLARTPTIGSSVVARVAGRAGVAWVVAEFTGFIAGEVKWSKRVAGIIMGAITRPARTPTIGSSIVARVVGRAGVAWIVAGFVAWVVARVAGNATTRGAVVSAN